MEHSLIDSSATGIGGWPLLDYLCEHGNNGPSYSQPDHRRRTVTGVRGASSVQQDRHLLVALDGETVSLSRPLPAVLAIVEPHGRTNHCGEEKAIQGEFPHQVLVMSNGLIKHPLVVRTSQKVTNVSLLP